MNLKSLKKFRTAAVVLAVTAAGICYSCGPQDGDTQELVLETMAQTAVETSAAGEESSPAAEAPSAKASYFVHVCGQVNEPGVYELEPGSRIYQAVEMAGGFAPEAAVWYLNLAQEITDGMKIQVPTEEEAADWTQSGPPAMAQGQDGESIPDGGKVNLNTAGREQLMTLTGIGESRADDIIRYREEHGPFERIEDIMNVSGIKDGAFQKIKDSITV